VFAILRLAGDDLTDLDIHAEALREAGHPVITINLEDPYDVAAEFMRWEIATATAGAVLAINPFDQPNVQESKDVTKKILRTVEEQGDLPPRVGGVSQGGLTIYGEAVADDVVEGLAILFHDIAPGSYVSIQAYLRETPPVESALSDLQALFRDELGVATTRGYGPRFLHSTGQYHKGGPAQGVFVQIVERATVDREVPGQPFTFGVLLESQARGDASVLAHHNPPSQQARVHGSGDGGSRGGHHSHPQHQHETLQEKVRLLCLQVLAIAAGIEVHPGHARGVTTRR
jgi:hypothetical protein